MRLKIYSALLAASAFLLTVSCSKSSLDTNSTPQDGELYREVTINVGSEGTVGASDKSSRVGINFDAYTMFWHETDELGAIQYSSKMIDSKHYAYAPFAIASSGYVSSFTGNVFNNAESILFFYPSNMYNVENNKLDFDISKQTYDMISGALSKIVVFSESSYDAKTIATSNQHIPMKHLLSYPRVGISVKSGLMENETFKVTSVKIKSAESLFLTTGSILLNDTNGADMIIKAHEAEPFSEVFTGGSFFDSYATSDVTVECLNSLWYSKDANLNVAFTLYPIAASASDTITVEVTIVTSGNKTLTGSVVKSISGTQDPFPRAGTNGLLCEIDFAPISVEGTI